MTESIFDKYTKLMELMYQHALLEHTNFLVQSDADESVKTQFHEVISDLEKVDQIISSTLENYTIDRLNKVDLAIVRIATYELMKRNIPAEVIINLAIELTKSYSDLDDEKQHKFTNRLLDNIYKKLK